MLMFMTFAPRPDAVTWPGRRLFAVLDALAWPALYAVLAARLPGLTGIVLGMILALCVLSALARVRRAVWRNERYRFTTSRWGKVLAVLLWIGLCVQLAMLMR
ncbi:MAG: hypothetical protein ABIN08_08530 [Caldimonas sp.]